MLIMAPRVHSGRTTGLGIDFGKAFPQWKSVVEPAMIDFASRVFREFPVPAGFGLNAYVIIKAPEIRVQRALPGTEDGNPGGVTQPVNEYLREREENIARRKQLEQELHDEWTSLGNEFATTKRAGLSHKNQRPNARAASSDSVQHTLRQSM
jgi:hypothetical protein